MNQRNAIKAALTNDATWAALVTGGTYLRDDLGRDGLTLETATYDTLGQLLPTAVLVFGTVSNTQLWTSERRFFQVFCYAHVSFDTVDQMKRLATDILHRSMVQTDDEGLNFITKVDGGQHFNEDSLKGAAAAALRFAVDFTRR